MKLIILTISILYVTFCAVLFFLQRKMLYFPQPITQLAKSEIVLNDRDVPARQKSDSTAVNKHGQNYSEINFTHDGVELAGWVINQGRKKALLYYGGNAEQIEGNIEFFTSVLPNYTVYLIFYRGYGNSGGVPTETNLLNDALFIFDSLVDKYTEFALVGRSLGSSIATYVAAHRPVEKLMLITPFDSIENVAKQRYWMLPVSLLLKDKYRSWMWAKKVTSPTLILIAEEDTIISRRRTDNLIDHFEFKPRQIVVPKAGHNDISLFPQYDQAIKLFLNPPSNETEIKASK